MSAISRERTGLVRASGGRGIRVARAGAALAGYVMLLAAIAVVLFYPNGWLPVVLAGAATTFLAFDRKLGPLGAALLVMLALPVGRGSEIGLPRIGDIPVRPHDLAPLVGAAMTLPAAARRLAARTPVRMDALLPIIAFAAIGVMALLVGLSGDHALRDVVRDARWWAFYAIGGLALLAGTSRTALMRALVWGLTIYASIVIIGLLMPLFHGGLKYGAYAYDPRLRLHYGQAVLLLLPIAFGVTHVIRRPTVQWLALLALLAAAIGVTLTRTLLVGALGVTMLTAAWASITIARRARGTGRRTAMSAAGAFGLVTAAVVVGLASGFGAYQLGVQTWTPDWAYSTDAGQVTNGAPTDARPVRPSLGRVFDDTENSGFSAQAGGRLASYAEAFVDTRESPLVGHGMGRQATISWAWGGVRASTPGSQPGVDNAYLTIGLKAGALGIATFAAMVLWPLRQVWRPSRSRMRLWFVPSWLALLGLTLIQSFAVSGYAPFALSLVVVLPALGWSRRARPYL